MSRKIVLIGASPRVEEATASGYFLGLAAKHFETAGAQITGIDVRRSLKNQETAKDYEAVAQADAVVIAFPLYFFCLPGMLTGYLEGYLRHLAQTGAQVKAAKVYAIVNCGFPEAGINSEAARVIRCFAARIGARYRFSLLIGAGGMVQGAKDAPFMKKTNERLDAALEAIARDALSDEDGGCADVEIEPKFPQRLYHFLVGTGFRMQAKKNGLSRKDLRRMPYYPGKS